ncbi:MAG: hypothetical protein COA47_07425 [Robiginitomaculum sp.]|nr:MAG: hypothetical protein COA47_07425 [Robiginitomaculum sp.]
MKFPFLVTCAAIFALSACQTSGVMARLSGKSSKPNEGPCPHALVLADAARKIQIGEPQTYPNVGFTGEILSVRSFCTYVGEDPIRADLVIDFAFGRGPAAQGYQMDYPYFVAVTRKDRAVISKQVYALPIRFNDTNRIVRKTEKFASITIPRKQQDTSGANFEIIIGFDLNEAELAFARSGRRFRVDAGSQ